MLTDDLVATNLVRQANLRVEFEPTCMLASPLDYSFGQMFDFLRRQYLIGRHYMPRWWMLTLLATTLTIFGFWGSLAALTVGLVWQAPGTWLPAVGCTALYLWGIIRASIRCDLARRYFPQQRNDLSRAMWFDRLATPCSPGELRGHPQHGGSASHRVARHHLSFSAKGKDAYRRPAGRSRSQPSSLGVGNWR
jgi:hypothetical protein